MDSCAAGKIHVSRWLPEKKTIGVVQLVHGIAEHTLRYGPFAEFLNSLGYMVVAEDHMGHGKSVGEGGAVGYFHGGWQSSVDDTCQLLTETQKLYPQLPYILLGHSMGSFISRTILIEHPEYNLAGCILCGTGWMPSTVIRAGILAAKSVCSMGDEKKPSPRLQSLAFFGYNRRVEHKRTKFDWLCRDAEQVDAYMADPMCGFDATAGLLRDMLSGMLFNQQKTHLLQMNKELPVHFIAGGDDPVGSYGKGVMQTVKAFESAGMEHITSRIYPLCRHELLNELNKQEIWQDVAAQLEKFAGVANKSVL